MKWTKIIQGLVAGGNDYITKPYDVNEFAARVKAQFRLKSKLAISAGTVSLMNFRNEGYLKKIRAAENARKGC